MTLCSIPRWAPTVTHRPLNLSYPVASAVIKRRQLARQVGEEEKMATGALPQMGPFIDSPVRVVSGLVQRFGRLDFVSDTTGVLGSLLAAPSGCVVPFGNVLVFMAVVPDESSDGYPDEVLSDGCGSLDSSSFDSSLDGYPSEVLSDGCSSIGSGFDAFPDVAEVFVASSLPPRPPAGEGGAGSGAGCSKALAPNRLTEVLNGLRSPITPGVNLEAQVADLDAVR